MNKTFGFLLLLAAVAGQAFADVSNVSAPEIDPGSAVSALGLLSGGLLVWRAGRKKK